MSNSRWADLVDGLETALAALGALEATSWLLLVVLAGLPLYLWLLLRERRADAAGFARAETLAAQHVSLLNERLESRSAEFEKLEAQLRQQLGVAQEAQAQEIEMRTQAEAREVELRVRLQTTREAMTEREQLLQQNGEALRDQFSLLARDVLEQQGKTIAELGEAQLNGVLNPFRDQVSEFKRRIDEIHHLETRERASLLNEVQSLQRASAAVNTEAANLTRALKGDKRVQGQWGEMILERLLQGSGLTEGREYETQFSVTLPDGQIKRPDVVVHLPDNKDVIIDAKVSLTAFERLVRATDSSAIDSALKQHLLSLRTHIKELAARQYEDLPGLRSLDLVLLFVPVEGALSHALEADSNLFEDALKERIMLVSPSTLLLSLRVIHSLWRNEKQHRNAREIAERAGGIYDKVRLLAEDIEQMGRQLAGLDRLVHSARNRLTDGRGNLVRQIEQVRELGARVKTPVEPPLVERAAVETAEAAE